MPETTRLLRGALALALCLGLSAVAGAGSPRPPDVPAKITLEVSPEAVGPGDQARVRVQLEPIQGIKINRYPRIQIKVAEVEGLVGASESSVGSTKPFPPGETSKSYFKTVDLLELSLTLDEAAPAGKHEIGGKLVYYYCMGESFCAPKRVALKIPVTVR